MKNENASLKRDILTTKQELSAVKRENSTLKTEADRVTVLNSQLNAQLESALKSKEVYKQVIVIFSQIYKLK